MSPDPIATGLGLEALSLGVFTVGTMKTPPSPDSHPPPSLPTLTSTRYSADPASCPGLIAFPASSAAHPQLTPGLSCDRIDPSGSVVLRAGQGQRSGACPARAAAAGPCKEGTLRPSSVDLEV